MNYFPHGCAEGGSGGDFAAIDDYNESCYVPESYNYYNEKLIEKEQELIKKEQELIKKEQELIEKERELELLNNQSTFDTEWKKLYQKGVELDKREERLNKAQKILNQRACYICFESTRRIHLDCCEGSHSSKHSGAKCPYCRAKLKDLKDLLINRINNIFD